MCCLQFANNGVELRAVFEMEGETEGDAYQYFGTGGRLPLLLETNGFESTGIL